MESRKPPIPPALEFLIVIGLTYGVIIYGAVQYAFQPHTFRDVFTNRQLLSLVIFEVFAGGLALAILRFNGRRFSDHDTAFTATTIVDALLLYVGTMLVAYVLYDLALLAAGSQGTQPAPPAPFGLSFPVVLLASLVNPFFEEGVLLAYVVPALRSHGLQTALGVSLILRLATHLYQGPAAAIAILPMGLLFSGYYWRTRKIWPPILAHALQDLVGLMLLG